MGTFSSDLKVSNTVIAIPNNPKAKHVPNVNIEGEEQQQLLPSSGNRLSNLYVTACDQLKIRNLRFLQLPFKKLLDPTTDGMFQFLYSVSMRFHF
jgi:hypothetical protein